MASIYSMTRLSQESIWDAAAADAAQPAGKSLVCIYLNGGNDGLNMIVPVASNQYAGYVNQRGNIARALGPSTGNSVGTTVMPGTGATLAFANPGVSGAGNNADTKGFDTLYGDGSGASGSDLAVFPAADYTPPNLSHFESRDYWFAGALERAPDRLARPLAGRVRLDRRIRSRRSRSTPACPSRSGPRRHPCARSRT